ncbi:MAG: endo alpha-1,4 polygalactosaminidase [bacterium]|nr:endo alpha-1,4 polygalactosaminidase [bacterium]MBU1916565.1 endo alpha-1,4 polygalactosaminidase [bacterium]
MNSWLCFYKDTFPPSFTYNYDLYILDRNKHPDLNTIKKHGGKTVGYVSFGEVNIHDAHYKETKMRKLLVDKNPRWPDAIRVQIGHEKWHTIILNKVIPETIAKGFDGIFIDTIDTAQYLEEDKKMRGSIAGAIQLINKIRKKYPKLIMVMNNGLFILDQIGKHIDALVVEDVYTTYNFKINKYQLAKKSWTQNRKTPLKAFYMKHKKPVLPLEYLKASDIKGMKKVTEQAKNDGFIPYISDIHLTKIFYHP